MTYKVYFKSVCRVLEVCLYRGQIMQIRSRGYKCTSPTLCEKVYTEIHLISNGTPEIWTNAGDLPRARIVHRLNHLANTMTWLFLITKSRI